MASAYVSGDPTRSLLQFYTVDYLGDRTYYGNGCPNEWGTSGEGGSDVPCESSLSTTFDGETQKIGTYYNNSAVTSGSGGSMTEKNIPAPDSFCPLGWQVPYGGTGGDYYDKSMSWKYLIDTTYHLPNNTIGATAIGSYPLSITTTGEFYWDRGMLYTQTMNGMYWGSVNANGYQGTRFVLGEGSYILGNDVGKGNGRSARCVKFLASFIDGTVAGTPADLTVYIDENVTHDHTYYGRGCKNGWGTSGEEGSLTPCADSDAGGRYVKTADNETQKNGTYYHYQTATSGTGGGMSTENSNSPDTFCPLGWQLPYSGTGGDYYDKSRSWRYLFTKYDISFNDSTAADATKVKSYPFSYVFSGNFSWRIGRLYYQSNSGYYWSPTPLGSNHGYYLGMWSTGVNPVSPYTKVSGLAVRCVLGISNLKALHGIRVHSLVLWLFIF